MRLFLVNRDGRVNTGIIGKGIVDSIGQLGHMLIKASLGLIQNELGNSTNRVL